MKMCTAIALVIGACLSATPTFADGSAPAKVTAVCQSCHGLRGDSTTPSVPRLNGQHEEYIAAQLKSFLDPGRQDPHATAAMWGVVRNVDDATLAVIARYYAGQEPTQPSNGGALAAEGRKFYASGDAAMNVPSCQSCHGANAEGRGTIPRLAGQHADYLRKQLERLRFGLRASDVMHPRANNISDHQIDALIAFLAKD